MFVLCLRRLDDPSGPSFVVAHSESESSLEDFIAFHSIKPVVDTLNGKRVLRVFNPKGELGDYCAPSHSRDDEGIRDLGTLDDRVNVLIDQIRPSLEQQVKEAWSQMTEGSVKV